MPEPDLSARANALHAEAKSARADVASTYQSRMKDIDTDMAKTRRDGKIAEAAAKQSTDDAKDASIGSRLDYKSAMEYDESAAKPAKRGDTKTAEEDTESAAHFRMSAKRYEAQERDATLEAVKYRAEAADYEVHRTELTYQVRDVNGLNNVAERELDDLEDQARMLDEAVRKFDAAGSTTDPKVKAKLEKEAEAALAKADAIDVDRAAIRALAPDFPEQTPGLDAAVSATTQSDDDADPTALAFATGDEDGQVASADQQDDLLASPGAGETAVDDESGRADSGFGFAPESTGDDGYVAAAAAETAGGEEFTFDTPAPEFADVSAQEPAFDAVDTFAESDFASVDAPADTFAEPEPTFDDTGFA